MITYRAKPEPSRLSFGPINNSCCTGTRTTHPNCSLNATTGGEEIDECGDSRLHGWQQWPVGLFEPVREGAADLVTSTSDPELLVAEAARHLNAGDLAAAELDCRNVLAATPRQASADMLLGAVLLSQGRYAEAQAVFTDLAEREPDEPSHWINLGTARRGMGEYDGALVACGRAAALGVKDPDFYFNVGLTHLDRGDFESARLILEKARQLDPADAEITLRYADACYRLLRNDAAAAALAGWRSLTSLRPNVLSEIARLLVNLGVQHEGEQALEIALADPTADAVTLLTGIEIAERINRLDQAQALVARLESDAHPAAIDEDLVIIRARLAQRSGDHAAAVRLYGQALLANADSAMKHMELFPLVQSLDAQGRYAEAMTTLQQAHTSQHEYLRRISPALTLAGAPPMLITRESCDPEDVAAWQEQDAPSIADSPVFIVAFPRSGTTLLEVTLDAHPALQSMDEQPFIQDALDEIRALRVNYPRGLVRLSRSDLATLRANYWRRVASKIQLQPGARLVDKNPLNILRLPVIRRLFPNAPILLGVRHPCDVILSCYMQHFRAPEFALLCNSPLSLARGYQRTIDFWFQQSEILRPDTLEVRYETLVTDFEREVRAILRFLGLPWSDRVLLPGQHARDKSYISTPSYPQVVSPISNKSVDRWRHYAGMFVPLIPIIQPQLDRWNYAAVA
jgi:tetratricopeptide (TPR) repeat protein